MLGGDISECEMAAFTEKMESFLPDIGDHVDELTKSFVDKDFPSNILEAFKKEDIAIRHLLPPVKMCCDTNLTVTEASKCIVFERFNIYQGVLYKSYCRKCKNVYHLSYFSQGDKNIYYNDAHENEYFESTRESVFQTKFLKAIDINM